MIWLIAALLAGFALMIYLARAAWAPFGSHGRRRLVHWARSWWIGGQSENRDLW